MAQAARDLAILAGELMRGVERFTLPPREEAAP